MSLRHVRLLVAVPLVVSACGSPDPVAPAPEPPDRVVIETENFSIVDEAGVAATLLDSLALRLELERGRVAGFFTEFVVPNRIVFTIRSGNGIPFVNIGDNTMNQWEESLAFDYIPHQLTHLWTRYTRRSFLEEGIAVYVTELLLPDSRVVNPYRGQVPHAWVSLFDQNGTGISLFSAYRAGNFSFSLQGSPSDAFAWQVFVQSGSFTRWVIETFGRETWFQLFQTENLSASLGASTVDLERSWLEAARVDAPSPLPCEQALEPVGARESFWCAAASGN